ncbi:MAG TPA: polysaccharide deacetylase family protein [Candidatus Dormibacteraeota bacterium]|nr:polysaccharide deacetylase family protein [Candidatus Dormibacteraeota bacterium]
MLKRWARRLVAGGSRLAGIGRGGRLRPGLRILTYHRVAEDRQDPFAVSRSDFIRQMETVSQTGAVQPLEEAIEGMSREGDTGPRIALTFDDGTEDFLSCALPVIRRLGLPATLYVSPLRVGERGFLNWEELSAVCRMGVRIGSHGWDHQSLGRLNPDDVWQQVTRSRDVLQDRLGLKVSSLAYPYGTVRDFNDHVKELIRRAGYLSACTSVNGVNRKATDPYELLRTKIEQGDGPSFQGILCGGLDAWALIDRNLTLIQNRYA